MFTQKSYNGNLCARQGLPLFIPLVMVILGIALTSTAHAATITVNSTDGEMYNNDNCSLHEAIEAANTDSARDACPAGSGADTINLSIVGIISLSSPLPPIQQALTIVGPGKDQLTIHGNDQVAVINVAAGITAAIHNLTIAHGYSATEGGAIYNLGTLTLSNCTVDSSQASSGAIFSSSGATLDISHCTVSNNTAANAAGAIYNEGWLTISDSTFSHNNAISFGGGAIFNRYSLTINHSNFLSNTATYDGGAILNDGAVNIIDSTFAANIAGRSGGGLWSAGAETIQRTIFTNNQASSNGGGLAIIYPTPIHEITDSTFSQNKARVGGGVYLDRVTLTLAGSTFSQNEAGFDGGGIYNEASVTLVMKDSRLSGNQAIWNGGGLYNLGSMTVTNSALSGNHTLPDGFVSDTSGGGIYNGGTAMINNTLLNNNYADRGGGIENYGSLTINTSTISDNYTKGLVPFSGGIDIVGGTATINNSLLSGNHIDPQHSNDENVICSCGGGIMISYNSTLTLNNSTLSGNSINVNDPHEIASGGIYNHGKTTVNNSTFSGNYTLTSFGADNIYNDAVEQIVLHNTIIADNPASTLDSCHYYNSIITDGGYNLDSGNSCGFSAANGSLINTDPKLGPLADNGGATQTHALQPGSPAIDAGDDIVCIDPDTVNRLDQRGVVRPQGAQCDIGAYEFVYVKEIKVSQKAGQVDVPITSIGIAFSKELEGSNNPTALAVTIDNAHPTGVFAWSVQSDASWLQTSPAFGNNTPVTVKLEADIQGLPPGVHTAHVIVTSSDPLVVNSPYPIAVTIEIAPQNSATPILRVNQGTLGFDATVGEGNPPVQFFTVENLGGGALNWQATLDASAQAWLAINGTNTASGAAPATVNVAVNSIGLSPGTYVGTITVNNTSATASPQTITVVLSVQPGPTLELTTRKLVFVGRKNGSEPAAQTVGVRNGGAGTFTWGATENSHWLTLAPGNGSLPGTIMATASLAGLSVGTYADQIVVSSPTAAGSPVPIDVVLGVLAGPVLAVDQQSLAFDMTLGSATPEPAQVVIRNASFSTLDWTATENIAWLELLQPASGQIASGGAFALQARVIGTPAVGVHTGQIMISSPNADASPQVVQVTLTVANSVAYCDVQAGGIDLLYTTQAKLRLNVTGFTSNPTGGCHLAGELRLTLPQNANLVANVEGDASVVDGKAVFTANASSELILEIANFKLKLAKQNLVIREAIGLTLNSTGWELPALFGGGFQAAGLQVTVGPTGVTFSGQRTFALPNLNWGSFSITNNLAEVLLAGDGQYQLKVTGQVKLTISGSSDVTSSIVLTLDKQGIRTGTISSFTLQKFAGLDLVVKKANVSSDRLTVEQASLKVPAEWGGGSASLYNLLIKNSGAVSFGGAEFKLPDIKAGGDAFQLTSLKGKLRSRSGGGYQIEAGGAFGMAGLPNGRSCQMAVEIVLHTGGNGASVLTIQSVVDTPAAPGQPSAVNGLQLDEFEMEIHCRPGWPIATTGFSLTGVKGSISLVQDKQFVSIQLWIESDLRFGSTAAISTEPSVTLRPKPFQIEFAAPIKIVNFKSLTSNVDISGKLFSAELKFEFKVLHGGFKTKAGIKNRDFYFSGSGFAEIRIDKGSIAHECIKYVGCADIPPRTYTLDRTEAYFDLDRIEVSKKVFGRRVTLAYDFHSGRVSVHRGLLAQTVTGEQIVAAQQRWQARQQGAAATTAQDQTIAFENDGVIVELPVPQLGAEIQAADVITPYTILRSDVIFILVQPVTSTLQFSLLDPTGQEITPDTLPANVQYEQIGMITATQTLYAVTEAIPGSWRAKIIGNTQGRSDFFIHYTINNPPPILSDLGFAATANPNEVQISWRLSATAADTPITIYAASAPLNTTVAYTDADGSLVTADTPLFAGVPVKEDVASAIDGTQQNNLLDLSTLPSGEYAFWLEAVVPNGDAIRCFIGQDNSCDQNGLKAIKYTLDHATVQASSVWTPVIDTAIDIEQGDMFVEWDLHPHPDISSYLLHLRTTDPFSPSVTIVREYLVGPVGNARGYAIAGNIEPGQTYYVAIGAQDLYHGQTIWSPEHEVIAPQPEFLVNLDPLNVNSADAQALILIAGGAPVAAAFNLEMASNLPYSVVFDLDYQRLPDGIYVTFDTPFVPMEQTQTQVIAQLSASATLVPGDYVVPIVAHSGLLEHNLNLVVTVESAEGPATNQIYLPIIRK